MDKDKKVEVMFEFLMRAHPHEFKNFVIAEEKKERMYFLRSLPGAPQYVYRLEDNPNFVPGSGEGHGICVRWLMLGGQVITKSEAYELGFRLDITNAPWVR